MNRFPRCAQWMIVLVAAIPFPATAATLNVPVDFLLTEALIQAETGDTILFQPGVQVVDDSLEILVDDLKFQGSSGNPDDVKIEPDDGDGVLFYGTKRKGLSFEAITFNRASGTFGSAFGFLDSDFEIDNCVISNCTGEQGAAAILINGTAVIRDTTFRNNIGCAFGTTFFPGGALAVLGRRIQDIHVEMIDCTFENNVNQETHGGALTIYQTDFEGVKGRGSKGLPLPEERFVLSATRCFFSGNRAAIGNGGAIYLEEPVDGGGPIVEIFDSEIRGGTAEGGGGIAFNRLGGYVDLRVFNTHFERNLALNGDGGGMLIYEATPEFQSKGFSDAQLGSKIEIRDSTFALNLGERGGAVAVVGREYRTVYEIENCVSYGNVALQGGALFIGPDDGTGSKGFFDNEGTILLEGTVRNNDFQLNGVPLADIIVKSGAKGSSAFVEEGGAAFIAGSSTELKGNFFAGNLANRGGAVYLDRDGSHVTQNFFGNPEGELEELLFPFQVKGTPQGGPSIFDVPSNLAYEAGAGLYLMGSADISKGLDPPDRPPYVAGNLFALNFSFQQGGGMQVSGYPSERFEVFIGGNVFQNNIAYDGSSIGFNEVDGNRDGEFFSRVAFVHNTLFGHTTFCDLVELANFKGSGFTDCDELQPTSDSMIYLGPAASPLIANNAIVAGTELADATGIFEFEPVDPRVLHNAFYNLTSLYFNDGSGPASLFGINNQSQNGGNIAVDPMFEEPNEETFNRFNPHLEPGSPLINQATDLESLLDLEMLLPVDFDEFYRGPDLGDPRILDGTRDIGADERPDVPTATPTETPSATATETFTPTETPTPSETPTGTLPTATLTPTPTDTMDGVVTPTETPTGTLPTATETPTEDLLIRADVNRDRRVDTEDILIILEYYLETY